MTLAKWFKAKKTLCILALLEGCSIAQIRNTIQSCIDYAWDQAWTPGNLQAQVNWQRIFPGGRKPTVEQFIIGMAQYINKI